MADSPEKKAERISTITAAVKVVIDAYVVGHEFYGNELRDDCVKLVPQYKDAYVDTFLKMARRHRRDSYIAIDHNNSLYKRVKSNIEIKQEEIKRKQAEELKRKEEEKNVKKPELPQGFFTFFFAIAFGVFFVRSFAFASDFGCPLTTSFIASKSACLYIPVGPTYLYGFLPLRCNRLFIASDDTSPPNAFAISFIVKSSIPSLYRYKAYKNQVANVQKFRNRDILLYVRIANDQYFYEISKNIFQNLDRALCRLYNVLMFRKWNLNKNGIGETERQNGSKGAKEEGITS